MTIHQLPVVAPASAPPRPAGIADVLGDQIGGVLRRIASGFIDAAGYLLQVTIRDLNGGLRVNLAADWIQHALGSMRYLVFSIVAIMFCLQIIVAMLRRDSRGLWRAVGGAALALIGGAAAAALAAAVLLVVDQFTAFILGPSQRAAENTMAHLFAMDGAIDAVGWLVVIIIAGLAGVAFLMIHLVLLGRNAMVIATVVFAPLAFAGATTERTKAWIGKWLELLIALALAKFVIAVIITLAFTSLEASVNTPTSGGGSTAQVMTGAMWLFVAAFSPLATMKFVTFAGGEIAGHHTTGTAEGVGNARTATHTATSAARLNPIHRRRHTSTVSSASGESAPPAPTPTASPPPSRGGEKP